KTQEAKQMRSSENPDAAFRNPDLPVEARVEDLVARLTLEEKVGQMMNAAPAIPRLGIPDYNWWNECLHGVCRAGLATMFPQSIGLAATWNTQLMLRIATAISDEARAKHHDALRQGNRDMYYGLTFWSPNINLCRDPRWGRAQETYGEDPYLTGRMAVMFVKGLQGDDPRYLKTVATPKHYAVHSGPEAQRHKFDARVSERELRETYLPHFKAAVVEGKAMSVMTAYSRVNGEACSASPTLLQKILRNEWGFEGYVVCDCGAISDLYYHHKVARNAEEASAIAVRAGCDLDCGGTYRSLPNAIKQGLLTEEDLDRAVRRLFAARIRLGMFDPPERVPYAQISMDVVDCVDHKRLALEAARQSIVLLKNADGLLPLDKSTLKRVAVIGPNAHNPLVLLGNYIGTPSHIVTPYEGIREALPHAQVDYAKGCDILNNSTFGFAEAIELARRADVAVLCLGLSQAAEGEENQEEAVESGERSLGDRVSLDLPGVQEALLKAIHATGTPVVLVLINGGPVAVNWADRHVPAILEAWYPGQAGGTAIADVLFGDYNPAGRLPVTVYRSADDLPPFEDYCMDGRTYRYFTGQPLYSFGYGLSYTTFGYANLRLGAEIVRLGEPVTVSVDVTNTGSRAGDEVVQLYLTDVEGSTPRPIRFLAGFQRVHLQPGETRTVVFVVQPEQLYMVNAQSEWVIEPGEFRVGVGGSQQPAVQAAFKVVEG
ncbi:MAG: glycoside hydrolase family 3 C-terminal domain-containing protein, partial [Anaerolineae bacterium]|nr:glycoside hydrolase family 3 C-terminal domain-containing protein [Thermoflexales bacterium]MDW8408667.1 glycoside hydrolase family 3 C-terminal domain-containing protein [Anaerolineae bacterium]